MKPKSSFPLVVVAVLSLRAVGQAASNTYINSSLLDVWNTSAANWTSPTIWANGDDAIFGGTGEGVAVTTVTAHNIDFNTNGYSLTGSTITLSGTTPTLNMGTGISASIASILAGSSGLKKDGDGTLVLTGANTYSAGTTVSAGTLQVGTGTVNGTVGAGAYSIGSGATLFLNANSAPGAPNYATITGAGALKLKSVNGGSFANWGTAGFAAGLSGTLQLEGGRLGVSAASTLGGLTAVTIDTGGQLLFSDTIARTYTPSLTLNSMGTNEGTHGAGAIRVSGYAATFSGNVSLTGNSAFYTQSGQTGSIKFTGVVSDGGSGFGLTINGRSNSNTGVITLEGVNTYSGATNVGFGVLELGGAAQLGSGNYVAAISLASATTLLYNSTAAQTLGGVISGAGALSKNNTGTLTLGAANTYSGATTITNGTVRINGSNSGAGAVNIAAGGRLEGTGSVVGAVNVSGTLAPGVSIESLGTGALVLNTGSTFDYQLNSSALNGDLLDSSGALSLNGTVTLSLTDLGSGSLTLGNRLTLINYTGAWNNGTFTYQGSALADNSTITVGSNQFVFDYNNSVGGANFASDQTGATGFVTMTVVPEPSISLLGGLGLLCLLRRRRRSIVVARFFP